MPTTPTNVSATVTAENEITVGWDDVGDETEYRVYRAQSSGGGTLSNYTQVATKGQNVTTHQDTGLLSGVEYFYVVTSYDGTSESAASNEVSQTTILPANTNLTVDNADAEGNLPGDQADLSWSINANNVAEQRVYVRRTGTDDDPSYERTGMDFSAADNDYIHVEDNPSLRIESGVGITMSAWVKSSDWLGSNDILSKENEYILAIESGSLYIRTWGDSNGGSPSNVPTGRWVHIAIAWNNSDTADVYIDGDLDETTTVSDTNDGGTAPVAIGKRSNSRYYTDGNISHVAFYKRMLSSSEVTELSNGNLVTTDLRGYWPLDLNRNGVTPDLSGYANHGTVNGPTLTGPSVNLTERTGMDFESSNDDHIDLGTVSNVLELGTGDFTFAFRSKPEGIGSYQTLMAIDKYTSGILIRPDNNSFDIYINDASWHPSVSRTAGTEYTYILTRSSGTVELWQNGTSQGTNSLSGGITFDSNNGETMIAQSVHSPGQTYDGEIYDVQVYNRALTSSERDAFRSGRVVSNGLVGYWPLAANNSGTTPDHSGYGNDGAVNGATIVGPAADATSYTVDGLLDGEEYEAYVHTLTGDNEVRDS